MSNSQIIMYTANNGKTQIEVTLQDENVWLTQLQMSELFQKNISTISRHINNVFDENELDRESNEKQIISEDSKKPIIIYSLDVIISVGYRVKSVRGTQFRIWANNILKEYMIKGFVLNDTLLKNAGQNQYWHELLERIRDIRSSEKMFWQQVLELYATSVDYNKDTKESIIFFKTVQNKIHYAAHGHTAAEIVYNRADSTKANMGLTNFNGDTPTRKEAQIAKNYLNENELSNLNTLVSAYFDLAELKAKKHEPMYMKNWIEELNKFCELYGQGVLQNAGKVSHKQAITKANEEYDKYKQIIDAEWSQVEKDYLETIGKIEQIAKKKAK